MAGSMFAQIFFSGFAGQKQWNLKRCWYVVGNKKCEFDVRILPDWSQGCTVSCVFWDIAGRLSFCVSCIFLFGSGLKYWAAALELLHRCRLALSLLLELIGAAPLLKLPFAHWLFGSRWYEWVKTFHMFLETGKTLPEVELLMGDQVLHSQTMPLAIGLALSWSDATGVAHSPPPRTTLLWASGLQHFTPQTTAETASSYILAGFAVWSFQNGRTMCSFGKSHV